jgi:hypothetical protein
MTKPERFPRWICLSPRSKNPAAWPRQAALKTCRFWPRKTISKNRRLFAKATPFSLKTTFFLGQSIRLPRPERSALRIVEGSLAPRPSPPEWSSLYRKAAFFAQSKGSPLHETTKNPEILQVNPYFCILFPRPHSPSPSSSELILVVLYQPSRAPSKISLFSLLRLRQNRAAQGEKYCSFFVFLRLHWAAGTRVAACPALFFRGIVFKSYISGLSSQLA